MRPEVYAVFSTKGSPVYHLQSGVVDKSGKRAIISAAYDGVVSCYRPSGELIWRIPTGGFFPNDLQIADLDGDGFDEILVASADGVLYAMDNSGELMWKYSTPAPLMTVCITKTDSSIIILTGGVEKKILALSSHGQLLNSTDTEYLVRFIRKGNVKGTNKDYAAVVFAKIVRGQFYMQLFDPVGLKPMWENDVDITKDKMREGNCYFDLLMADINKDGKDEMILSQGWRGFGKLSAYAGSGEHIILPDYTHEGVTTPTYRMNRLVHVKSTSLNDEYFLGVFGNQLLVYNTDLTLRKVLTTKYSYSGGTFDPGTNTFYMGSCISGGDCIHAFDLDNPEWGDAYESMKPTGKLAEVLNNISKLNQSIENFERPDYQKDAVPVTVMGTMPDNEFINSVKNVSFEELTSFHENFDRSDLPGIWKTKKETRFEYNDTQEQILSYAKSMEEKGTVFNSWAGHGNDPFYMQFETLEGIISNAPKTFHSFVFPEMERTDEAMLQALRTRVDPLAKLCKQNGKNIILRNKNVFWYGSCYLDLWKKTLFNPEVEGVFIPSMEETNCRTQDLSLNALVGLMISGSFEHYCARAVTDNAVYHRMWEWSSQQIHSHFIRTMLLQATLGSDIFMINIHQGDPAQMNVFYTMLDKGIIIVPKPEDLMAVSDICIGITDPSHAFIEHGANGWGISQYKPENRTFVFDRLDCFWGGAPTLPHDFSYYGTGTKNRMLNFLPKNPYGFVPFVSDDFDLANHQRFTRKFTTDGEFFYDKTGQKHTAEEYRNIVENELKKSALRLPVRVEGDVAWNVVRIDSKHLRIYLIDSGYIDPAERKAKVFIQTTDATSAYDILNKKEIPVKDKSFEVTVPAATFRIIDLTLKL